VERRRGQALVEFALVALVFYMLLAVTIEFGRLIFSAQVLQDSTRVMAREVAVTPFAAATPDLQTALDDSVAVDPTGQFKTRVYDEQWLFVDLRTVPGGDVDAFFSTKPLVNQMLRPLMIFERIDDPGSPGTTFDCLHYPGAIVNKTVGVATIQTVLIPQLVENPATVPHKLNAYEDDPASTVPKIEWLPVVQEVAPLDAAGNPNPSPFPASNGGLVSLRINYPFQSAAMTGFHVTPPAAGQPTDPDLSSPVVSNDAGFEAVAAPFPPGITGYFKDASSDGAPGPYGGRAGLGNQFAFTMTVRPYRKVVSAQAVFRREIFFR